MWCPGLFFKKNNIFCNFFQKTLASYNIMCYLYISKETKNNPKKNDMTAKTKNNATEYKRGQMVTYLEALRFNKGYIRRTATIVAIKGNILLLDNGDEVRAY